MAEMPDYAVQCGWCGEILENPEKIVAHNRRCLQSTSSSFQYAGYWIENENGIRKLYPVNDAGSLFKENPATNYAVYADDNWLAPRDVDLRTGNNRGAVEEAMGNATVGDILANDNVGNNEDVARYLNDNDDNESIKTRSSEYDKPELDELSDELDENELLEIKTNIPKGNQVLDNEQNVDTQEKFVDKERSDPDFNGYKELKISIVETKLWPKAANLDMLTAYESVKNERKPIEMVTEKLQKAGYKYTVQQIRRKYNELLTNLKKIKKYNATTGNDPLLNWPFYEYFEKICGNNANVEPVLACSSLNPTTSRSSSNHRKILGEINGINEKESERKKTAMSNKDKRKRTGDLDSSDDEVEEPPKKIKHPKRLIKKKKSQAEESQELYEKSTKKDRKCLQKISKAMSADICNIFMAAVGKICNQKSDNDKEK